MCTVGIKREKLRLLISIKQVKPMDSSILCLFFISCLLPGWSAGQSECSTDSPHSEDEIRELRLEHLKTNIRAQLGFTDIPVPPVPYPDEEDLDAEILSTYYQIVNATYIPEKCTTDEFYAKPINSFVGLLSEGESAVNLCSHSKDLIFFCKRIPSISWNLNINL